MSVPDKLSLYLVVNKKFVKTDQEVRVPKYVWDKLATGRDFEYSTALIDGEKVFDTYYKVVYVKGKAIGVYPYKHEEREIKERVNV